MFKPNPPKFISIQILRTDNERMQGRAIIPEEPNYKIVNRILNALDDCDKKAGVQPNGNH